MFQASVDRAPGSVAIVHGDERITYRELADRVARLAAGLRGRGVEKGDRIAILLNNGPHAIEIFLACAWLGAVLVPMNIRQRAPETEYILEDSGAAVLIFDAEFSQHLPAHDSNPALRLRLQVGGEAAGGILFDSVHASEPCEAPDFLDEEDPACLLYTSGTTGRPKGAVLTHFGVVHSCLQERDALQLQDGECGIVAAPVSHVTGLIVVSLATLLVAGRLVIMTAFKAARFLELAEREQLTFTVMVPAMYNLCLLDPTFASRRLERWRIAGFGGAPMPEATIEKLATHLPNLKLANIYGATESAGAAVIMPLEEGLAHPDAVGRRLPCVDILIMDDDGREVPRGQSGEVWIGGPNVTPRYWRNEEATRLNFIHGYWKSGDIGSVDADGFLSVFDRKKDMINRGGFKIYSVEVENVLSRLPGVREAAVVGRPCPVLGERVHAVLCAEPDGLSTEAVRAFCAERLSDYKVPDYVDIRSEPLPRNANGKVLKAVLREEILQAPQTEARA
jgi:acyl-CoA synthetase (AMP-forming)/AMP-acid ligase II